VNKQNVGSERSAKPEAPREMVSIDILYLPTSSKGHTHALLVSDLFSNYLSFYPLKSKSSEAVADAFRQYMSTQGVPKLVYSDSDMSFQGSFTTLLATYHVQHITSYPYTQQQNAVEAQVRIFKNAYRAALIDNPIINSAHWHILYPVVIIRLNAMITKYGFSREYIHYQNTLDTHLPIITTVNCTQELKNSFSEMAYKFNSKVKKFLNNKRKSKEQYKKTKKSKFLLHELVMRKVYAPASALAPTFTGPYRVIEIHELGLLLKHPKTGELCSVHTQNIRKISPEEFMTLLPSDFDYELIQSLDLTRYNKQGKPENIVSHREIKEDNTRTLRSGKQVQLNVAEINIKDVAIYNATFEPQTFTPPSNNKISSSQGNNKISSPILKVSFPPSPTAYCDLKQKWDDDIWLFASHISERQTRSERKKYLQSSFSSPEEGTLTIDLQPEGDGYNRKVKFNKITVKFY